MTLSVAFQILGSLCVLIGYWLNAKNHPRQHMAFIGGHIFLLSFTALESKWVLFTLSVIIIGIQYRISQKKWKFKRDMVRIRKRIPMGSRRVHNSQFTHREHGVANHKNIS
jgi:hypothetical protein